MSVSQRLRITLDYVPARMRPYVELIRLDKVCHVSLAGKQSSYFTSQLGYGWCSGRMASGVLIGMPSLTNQFAAWGLTMGAFRERISSFQFAHQLASAFLVALIMRCIACTINDICDIEFDKAVG
jgi:hypothetical protein